MFFSPELLARRDSGFGLLWLAATLGSKSTFKKLPKRSVLTADITELCDLISEPSEPLALRLSSNLMIGVARVYKVKQEIFLTDVANCVTSLKKVVYEIRSAAAMDAELQMAQTSTRPSAVTLTVDPKTACAIDFDALVADWDEYLNVAGKTSDVEDEGDGDFDPKSNGHGIQKKRPKLISLIETARYADPHTLEEHHEDFLSASFDLSFSGSGSGIDLSSSQINGGFSFDDNLLFEPSEELDLGGVLGDELARELGEGWGVSSDNIGILPIANPASDADLGMAMDVEGRVDTILDDAITEVYSPAALMLPIEEAFRESTPPPLLSPAISFSRQLLSQDIQGLDIPLEARKAEDSKKTKRTRLLLDARTELTDEELKAARSRYLDAQLLLRRDMIHKRSEKYGGKVIEDKIWGVPCGIQAQVLINFWVENFKVQVEARSGIMSMHADERRPAKRRKVCPVAIDEHSAFPEETYELQNNLDEGGNHGEDWEMAGDYNQWVDTPVPQRSSEEPGQGRRAQSRQPSVGFGLDFGVEKPGGSSQKSSMFPWDDAGAASSSSAENIGFVGSDNMQVDQAETKLRGSSQSRRESPLAGSQMGSILGGVGLSPAIVRADSQGLGEDYIFDVDAAPIEHSVALESQRSELHKITLERNSYNFLEYAKMQNQTLPSSAPVLTFDTVVPKIASTRHVAAAAFYHCLVLGTKDLFRFEQPTPYGPVTISIV